MKFTLSMLQKHLDTASSSLETILKSLTNLGIEVEQVINKSEIYRPFIIAKIEEASAHPNAQNLKICKVNNGKEILQIVCGAPNARSGLNVVLAPIDAIIPLNGMAIKSCKIRGVESNGMLCSAQELCLDDTFDGIIELADNAPIGTKFVDFAMINDVIIDVAITPNRGDLISVYGLARDLSAASIGQLTNNLTPNLLPSIENSPIDVHIADTDACPEFLGRYIKGVKNFEAVGEVAKSLSLVGISPKTMLVALSNYSMVEFGRPNHIYDADKIDGNIVVRKAKNGEKFIALGGEELTLDDEILIIADEKKVLGVAGIIGGELSAVDENTTNIFIEVANFNPLDIARAGRKLNINTDARYRFERRVDFAISRFFIEHLTAQILDSCGGKASNLIIKEGVAPDRVSELSFSFDSIAKIAGFEIDLEYAKNILQNLGFIFEGNQVKIPSYRQGDIVHQNDLVEEVLRVYGLDNIPCSPLSIASSDVYNTSSSREDIVTQSLRAKALHEVISWSFMEEKTASNFGFDELLRIQNPISQELAIMRPSIIPNLLDCVKRNLIRGFSDFGLFESGHIFGKQYHDLQIPCISTIRVGNINSKSVYKEERKVDFYDAKTDVFSILHALGFNPEKLSITREAPQYYHPGKSAALKLGNKVIAYAGELHPKILKLSSITEMVVGSEVFLNNIPQIKIKNVKGKLEISDLQPIFRDFAFVVKHDIEADRLAKAIEAVDKNIITNVTIFDVYVGKGVPDHHKSIAFNVKIQPRDKTMLDSEIEALCDKIIQTLKIKFHAELR